jgi:hypothetical protein
MSRNGSGVYSLPAGNPVIPNTTISTTWANNTLTDISTALTGSVAADGQTPITGNLQMGSNKITGLAVGTLPTDAVNLSQLNDPVITGNVSIAGTLAVAGVTTLASALIINSTDDIKIPVGTTAQRPAVPANGMIRYNSTTGQYEGFNTVASSSNLSTITNVLLVASATTAGPHGLVTGNYVNISGCTPAAYNGTFSVTVTGDTTFNYTMLTNPLGSATVVGTYTVGLWTAIGGGATGSGGNQVFVLNDQTVTVSYTIPTGKNASSAGPITIATGVTVTVPNDSYWVIV